MKTSSRRWSTSHHQPPQGLSPLRRNHFTSGSYATYTHMRTHAYIHTHIHTHLYIHAHIDVQCLIPFTCYFCSLHSSACFLPPCRALHDFDAAGDSASPPSSLSFRQGDIIHVLNAGSEEWWQAAIMTARLEDGPTGLIPSRRK